MEIFFLYRPEEPEFALDSTQPLAVCKSPCLSRFISMPYCPSYTRPPAAPAERSRLEIQASNAAEGALRTPQYQALSERRERADHTRIQAIKDPRGIQLAVITTQSVALKLARLLKSAIRHDHARPPQASRQAIRTKVFHSSLHNSRLRSAEQRER